MPDPAKPNVSLLGLKLFAPGPIYGFQDSAKLPFDPSAPFS